MLDMNVLGITNQLHMYYNDSGSASVCYIFLCLNVVNGKWPMLHISVSRLYCNSPDYILQ